MKFNGGDGHTDIGESLPPRGAWIEMPFDSS